MICAWINGWAKQSWGWWFATPLRSLCCHRNVHWKNRDLLCCQLRRYFWQPLVPAVTTKLALWLFWGFFVDYLAPSVARASKDIVLTLIFRGFCLKYKPRNFFVCPWSICLYLNYFSTVIIVWKLYEMLPGLKVFAKFRRLKSLLLMNKSLMNFNVLTVYFVPIVCVLLCFALLWLCNCS